MNFGGSLGSNESASQKAVKKTGEKPKMLQRAFNMQKFEARGLNAGANFAHHA
jgi:hypothetical protein